EPARQGLRLAAHYRCPRPGTRRSSHPGPACASRRRSADDRTRRHHRQHRSRRKHSRRSLMRAAGHRSTRLAGGAFPGSSFAGEPDRSGYACNLAGKLGGRCNELHVEASRGMNAARKLACVVVLALCAASLAANWLAPAGYARQFREAPSAPPSRQHLLGTDEVGRDRFARVLYGTRISLLLAPAAALLSTVLAALVGGLAGYLGGIWLRLARGFTDLFLSLPWLFLLIAVRALLPLNVSPLVSVLITFLILGLLGWAASARVLSTSADALRNSDFLLQARASGLHGTRLFLVHVLPNLKPVLYAQFWISIPVFILAEANLGILGLGVAEPLPSWGSLLRELEGLISFREEPWRLAPLLLLIVVITSFQLLLSNEEVTA